jgi:hypothetical protein
MVVEVVIVERRRLNGGFLFVHKRSMADTISVDRDEGRLPRLLDGEETVA